MDRPKELYY